MTEGPLVPLTTKLNVGIFLCLATSQPGTDFLFETSSSSGTSLMKTP